MSDPIVERMAFVLDLVATSIELTDPVLRAHARDVLVDYRQARAPLKVECVPPDVQREADRRASRWWETKGTTPMIRVGRVTAGARFVLMAFASLEATDTPLHQRRLVRHAANILERLDSLAAAD